MVMIQTLPTPNPNNPNAPTSQPYQKEPDDAMTETAIIFGSTSTQKSMYRQDLERAFMIEQRGPPTNQAIRRS